MTMPLIFQLLLSLLTLVVAGGAFVRAGRWRESDDAQRLDGRVKSLETETTVLKTKVEGMPSKSDIAKLTAEMIAVDGKISRVDATVNRIDNWLMDRAK